MNARTLNTSLALYDMRGRVIIKIVAFDVLLIFSLNILWNTDMNNGAVHHTHNAKIPTRETDNHQNRLTMQYAEIVSQCKLKFNFLTYFQMLL